MHIIQIGACGGKDALMSLLSEKIHLIEPLYHNFRELKNNYVNIEYINDIVFYNFAISTYTGKLTLYFQKILQNNPNNLDEHCSSSLQHLVKHGHEGNISSIIVDCYKLNDFIIHNNIESTITHLYLDTEGHDCDILLSTSFSNLDIQKITFETVHSDGPFRTGPKLQKTLEYLYSNGYSIENRTNFDITLYKKNNENILSY